MYNCRHQQIKCAILELYNNRRFRRGIRWMDMILYVDIIISILFLFQELNKISSIHPHNEWKKLLVCIHLHRRLGVRYHLHYFTGHIHRRPLARHFHWVMANRWRRWYHIRSHIPACCTDFHSRLHAKVLQKKNQSRHWFWHRHKTHFTRDKLVKSERELL